MQSTQRASSPVSWNDERAFLRALCHAFASADSQDEAFRATSGWARAALRVPDAGVRISVPDASDRLRLAWVDEGFEEQGRKHSTRRRAVFVSRRSMQVELSSPDRSSSDRSGLVMLPLVSRGESLGVLEAVAPVEALTLGLEPLRAVASQLAIALRHLGRQERLQGELQALRKAVLVGRAISSAGSTEAALRAAARFVSERFRAPVAVWGASDDSPDLTLIDVRGVGTRKRRELRAALPSLQRDPRASKTQHAAVAEAFTGLLPGIDGAEVVDGGDAVMLVGVPPSGQAAPMGIVAEMLEEALRRRTASTHPTGSGHGHLGIAWTAHELRAPLLGVKAVLEMMLHEGGDVSERDRERLSRSHDELGHLAGLVEGSLAWGAGAQPLRRRSVDLVELVEDVVAECARESGEQRVVVHAPAGAPVHADPLHLRTAIANVIRNGLSYSRPGTKVEASIEVRDGMVRLGIQSEGPAIAAGGPSVFDIFVRGEAGVGRRPAGRGLGLFIARRVVEAHGGRIWFESDDDGTTFFIRLPARGGRGR